MAAKSSELSRLFGIVIRMFSEVGAPHHDLPRRQRRLVEAWAELHQAELLADWQLLHSGRMPQAIDPQK